MAKQHTIIKVGDRYESEWGRGFTVTAVEGDEMTVDVERNVRSKDGHRSVELRSRVIAARDWDCFVGPYTKQRKKTGDSDGR